MTNAGYRYPDRVHEPDEGLSVEDFYSLHYTHSDRESWRQRIEQGQIKLNGRPASPNDRLARGDRLVYFRPPWEEPEVPLNFTALYVDPEVVVLAKPSGLPVLPGGGFLENTLLYLARRSFGASCSPLHRLGRATSGAILFTRNAPTARFLRKAMDEGRIRKMYLALASGSVQPEAFTIAAPIGPVPYPGMTTLHAFRPDGRPSVSHVRVIRRLPEMNAMLLEVTIPTGRPHQIRIHLSYAGFPLLGDPLYQAGGIPFDGAGVHGRPALPGDGGYSLHSWKIKFPHPERGEDVEVVSPPPPLLDPDEPAASA